MKGFFSGKLPKKKESGQDQNIESNFLNILYEFLYPKTDVSQFAGDDQNTQNVKVSKNSVDEAFYKLKQKGLVYFHDNHETIALNVSNTPCLIRRNKDKDGVYEVCTGVDHNWQPNDGSKWHAKVKDGDHFYGIFYGVDGDKRELSNIKICLAQEIGKEPIPSEAIIHDSAKPKTAKGGDFLSRFGSLRGRYPKKRSSRYQVPDGKYNDTLEGSEADHDTNELEVVDPESIFVDVPVSESGSPSSSVQVPSISQFSAEQLGYLDKLNREHKLPQNLTKGEKKKLMNKFAEVKKSCNQPLSDSDFSQVESEEFLRPAKYSGIGVEASYKYEEEKDGTQGHWVFTVKNVIDGSTAQRRELNKNDRIRIVSDNDNKSLQEAIMMIRNGQFAIKKDLNQQVPREITLKEGYQFKEQTSIFEKDADGQYHLFDFEKQCQTSQDLGRG